MIVDLPDTTVSAISKALIRVREEGGAVALGRVLTLIISTTSESAAEAAIAAANDASREHPMRLIVVAASELRDGAPASARLDAEIRVGGDAGASEVIVLRAWGPLARTEESLVTGLLLPDAPVVVWWPEDAPTVPAESPLGRIAQRRITDVATQTDPIAALRALSASYRPGDTDFAWTRLTLWRAQLAATLDQPPFEPILGATVAGALDSPATVMMAAWLALQLDAPVECQLDPVEAQLGGISRVAIQRSGGEIMLHRDQPTTARLLQPGQPEHRIALHRRSLRDCLADELRRLGPDTTFGRVIRDGVKLVEL
ncbi:MAG TPA: glucose-6-phosphate dehydrogenase assembly protein OpcA [Microbacteriaceae bacterium]|nr:glucose-6-phosphate dehydrogenase assembly protein OpcA [Microbacteriaceae bacterium]